MESNDFLTAAERELGERFLSDGYVVGPVEDPKSAARIRHSVAGLAANHLGLPAPQAEQAGEFLDTIQAHVDVARLNELRLSVIDGINAELWLRPAYFAAARQSLSAIVGNELAMQRRLNLSIQLPGDDSSLLPVHTDTWAGNSPFEVVLWLPLVDCRATKSMFLLPPGPDGAMQARLGDFANQDADDLFRAIEADVVWPEVPFGHFLLFAQTLMHGNRINREPTTRWSLNGRFKSVFSPYAGKPLGEFFEPVSLRAASRIGMRYRLPGGFDE